MKETTWSIVVLSCTYIHIYILGIHRIFVHRNFLAENGPKVHFRFSAEILLSPKQYGRNVVMTQTETATCTCLSEATCPRCGRISVYPEKDPRTAICKTCNSEISRGGASAKTFSASGLIYHLKSPPSTPTPSVADVFEKDVSQWHMGYGSLVFIHYYVESLQRKYCCIFKQLHLFWMHFLVVVLQRKI